MSLFPTEAPAPTGKTLSEIWPAIPINAATLSDAPQFVHDLNDDGIYYLTEDLIVPSGRMGIRNRSSKVVIDLNGFTIRGEEGAAGGIAGGLMQQRGMVIIRNGNITGCGGGGISFGGSLSATFVVENVMITKCHYGIQQTSSQGPGVLCIIRNCIVENCGIGIEVRNARISNTRSCGNFGFGFNLSRQAIVHDCIANRNGSSGFRTVSFPVACQLQDCVACDNESYGIELFIGGIVSRCILERNGRDGIFARADSHLEGNLCRGHSNGAGILAAAGCTLDDNYCVGNQTGVRLTGERNLMRRNVCSDNTTNWDVAEGNTGRVIIAMKSSGSDLEPNGRPLGSPDSRVNYTL